MRLPASLTRSGIRRLVDRLQCRGVGQTHAVQDADLGADALEALLAGARARHQILACPAWRALPQPIQSSWAARLPRRLVRSSDCAGWLHADGDCMDGAEFHRPQSTPAARAAADAGPGRYGYGRAEALIDAALPQLDELQPRQSPAKKRGAQQRRQYRGAQKGQRPAAREVETKMLTDRTPGARTACHQRQKHLSAAALAWSGCGGGRNSRAPARTASSMATIQGTTDRPITIQ